LELNQREFAVDSAKKIPDAEERIQMLIDIGAWKEAIEHTFNTKKQDLFLDDILAKGPAFVE